MPLIVSTCQQASRDLLRTDHLCFSILEPYLSPYNKAVLYNTDINFLRLSNKLNVKKTKLVNYFFTLKYFFGDIFSNRSMQLETNCNKSFSIF